MIQQQMSVEKFANDVNFSLKKAYVTVTSVPFATRDDFLNTLMGRNFCGPFDILHLVCHVGVGQFILPKSIPSKLSVTLRKMKTAIESKQLEQSGLKQKALDLAKTLERDSLSAEEFAVFCKSVLSKRGAIVNLQGCNSITIAHAVKEVCRMVVATNAEVAMDTSTEYTAAFFEALTGRVTQAFLKGAGIDMSAFLAEVAPKKMNVFVALSPSVSVFSSASTLDAVGDFIESVKRMYEQFRLSSAEVLISEAFHDPLAEPEVSVSNLPKPARMIFFGAHSAGKSSLCRYICQSWALGKYSWSTEILLTIFVPWISCKSNSMLDIVQRLFEPLLDASEESCLKILDLIKGNSDSILWVVDDYDPQSASEKCIDLELLLNQEMSPLIRHLVLTQRQPRWSLAGCHSLRGLRSKAQLQSFVDRVIGPEDHVLKRVLNKSRTVSELCQMFPCLIEFLKDKLPSIRDDSVEHTCLLLAVIKLTRDLQSECQRLADEPIILDKHRVSQSCKDSGLFKSTGHQVFVWAHESLRHFFLTDRLFSLTVAEFEKNLQEMLQDDRYEDFWLTFVLAKSRSFGLKSFKRCTVHQMESVKPSRRHWKILCQVLCGSGAKDVEIADVCFGTTQEKFFKALIVVAAKQNSGAIDIVLNRLWEQRSCFYKLALLSAIEGAATRGHLSTLNGAKVRATLEKQTQQFTEQILRAELKGTIRNEQIYSVEVLLSKARALRVKLGCSVWKAAVYRGNITILNEVAAELKAQCITSPKLLPIVTKCDQVDGSKALLGAGICDIRTLTLEACRSGSLEILGKLS